MPKRSKSSARWLREHVTDEYVKRAQQEGWRSRAVYKLEEIQKADRILKPGSIVVDLGAAPGAWSQYAAREVGEGCTSYSGTFASSPCSMRSWQESRAGRSIL